MRVSIESTGPINYCLTVELPKELINTKVEEELKKAATKAQIKGFRPGKAPLNLIKKNYEGSIRVDVADEQMRKNFPDAFKEAEKILSKSLSLVSTPEIKFTKIDNDGTVEFTANFEVFPEIDLKTLDGVTIEKIIPDISEQDINNAIESIRKQHISYQTVERPAQLNDEVIIDFVGKMDGEPLKNGEAYDTSLVLGNHQFIAGFEEGLIGATANQQVTLNLHFPKEYHQKDLSEKPVEFIVTIKEVKEPRLPELNETFFKAFNLPENTLDAFQKEIQTNMEREAKQIATNKFKETIFTKLAEMHEFTLPQALVKTEINNMRKSKMKEMKSMYKTNMSIPESIFPDEFFTEHAQYRIKLGLLLQEVQRKFDIQLNPQKLEEKIDEIVSVYTDPETAKQQIKSNKKQIAQLESLVLEEQFIEKLIEKASLLEKKEAYHHLINNHNMIDEEHEHGPDCDHEYHGHGPDCDHNHA